MRKVIHNNLEYSLSPEYLYENETMDVKAQKIYALFLYCHSDIRENFWYLLVHTMETEETEAKTENYIFPFHDYISCISESEEYEQHESQGIEIELSTAWREALTSVESQTFHLQKLGMVKMVSDESDTQNHLYLVEYEDGCFSFFAFVTDSEQTVRLFTILTNKNALWKREFFYPPQQVIIA